MSRQESSSSYRDTINVLVWDETVMRSGDRRRLADVDVDVVIDEMRRFGGKLSRIFASLPATDDGFRVDTVTVRAEIGASGKVSLLGSGVETTASAGIEFVFRRASV